jgi:hypothetical protein
MDDFQRAAAVAQATYAPDAWAALPVRTQAEAIYAELRRIDARRCAAPATRPRATPRATPRLAVATAELAVVTPEVAMPACAA